MNIVSRKPALWKNLSFFSLDGNRRNIRLYIVEVKNFPHSAEKYSAFNIHSFFRILQTYNQTVKRTSYRRLPKSKSNVPLNKAYTFTALSRSRFLPKNSQFWLLWLLFGYFVFNLFLLSTVFPSCQLLSTFGERVSVIPEENKSYLSNSFLK